MAPRRPPSPGPGADERDLYGEDDPLPDELLPAAARATDGDDEDEATRAGPPRKLVVLSGPEKGKVKRLTGVRMVMGRATGCHLQLEDRSISRRHLELIQGERGVLLRDLVSGNGTKVNGERVDERLLAHEDVIELGASRLQFIDELEAVKRAREEADRKVEAQRRAVEDAAKKQREDAEAAERAAANAKAEADGRERAARAEADAALAKLPPVRRAFVAMPPAQRRIVAAAGAILLLLVIGGGRALFGSDDTPAIDPRTVAAEKRLLEGRTALADERFEAAVEAFEAAERIKPGSDVDGLGAIARKQMAAAKSLEAARALMAGQRFDDARAELARAPEASAKLTAQREALEKELATAELVAVERAAEEALDALDPDRAAALIAQLPEVRRNGLQARLAEVRELAERQQAMDAASRQASAQRQRAQAAAARRQFLENAFRPVERKFHAQDFDRATLEVDRVADQYRGDADIRARAGVLKAQLPAFARSWNDAQKKVQVKALESALRPLRRAKELYALIALPGALGTQLDEQLADALVASAKAAIVREDLASGALLYKEALRIQPGDERAVQGLERLATRADELYLEAYMIRDREPRKSIEKLKLVLELAPRGSDPYRKAQAQLSRMSN